MVTLIESCCVGLDRGPTTQWKLFDEGSVNRAYSIQYRKTTCSASTPVLCLYLWHSPAYQMNTLHSLGLFFPHWDPLVFIFSGFYHLMPSVLTSFC